MIALRISGYTRLMGVNQPEYHNLAVRDHVAEDGTPFMETAWEPTPKELEMLVNGGSVRLFIDGDKLPPVFITAEPPPSLKE